MTATVKQFSLGAVVSVVDGHMVAPFGEIHELLEWMAGEPVWTHQLPRVSNEVRPALIAQFPGIETLVVPEGTDTWERVRTLLEPAEQRFGASLAVRPLAAQDHTSIDPMSELRMKRPDLPVVVVVQEDHA